MYPQPLRSVRPLLLFVVSFAVFVGQAQLAHGHTRWMTPAPRSNVDGYKPPGIMLPCGIARTAAQMVTSFPAGSTQMVRWQETIYHNGCYLIEFAPSDTGTFQRLANFPNPARTVANRFHQTMITLPNEPCTNCVLRIRQVMTDGMPATAACPPANMTDQSGYLYYSCANIALTGGGAVDGAADGGATDSAPEVAADVGGSGGGSGGNSGTGGSPAGTGGATGSGGSTGSGGNTGTGGGTGGSGAGTGGVSGGGSTGGGGCAVAEPTSNASLLLILVVGLMAVVTRRVTRRRRRN